MDVQTGKSIIEFNRGIARLSLSEQYTMIPLAILMALFLMAYVNTKHPATNGTGNSTLGSISKHHEMNSTQNDINITSNLQF